MICRLKLLLQEDDYLLGLQKRDVGNDHTSGRIWFPGSQNPFSHLPLTTCTPLPSPFHQNQLLTNFCSKLMQALTSIYCRRIYEVSRGPSSGWEFTLTQWEGEGQSAATGSAFTSCRNIYYMKPVLLLYQNVSALVNMGRSHIAVESTTVTSQIHSWSFVCLQISCTIADTIIRGLLKYHELEAEKAKPRIHHINTLHVPPMQKINTTKAEAAHGSVRA